MSNVGQIDRVCKTCGAHFKIPHYYLKKTMNAGSFCSKKCRGAAMQGGTSWNAGMKMSDEYKALLSASKPPKTEMVCIVCGTAFIATHTDVQRNRKCCSRSCANKAANGRKKPWLQGVPLSEETRRKISEAGMGRKSPKKGKKCPNGSMENHPNWKGGRNVCHGYVRIKMPDHPRADHQGYVSEHSLVVEQTIGHPIERTWVIHHINENKIDNRPENLYVFTGKVIHIKYHALLRKGYITPITESNLHQIRDNPGKLFIAAFTTVFTSAT